MVHVTQREVLSTEGVGQPPLLGVHVELVLKDDLQILALQNGICVFVKEKFSIFICSVLVCSL